MKYKVLQWASGNIGSYSVKSILAHKDLELSGLYVYSPEKAGKDIGEICGIERVGLTATNNRSEVLSMDVDCVVYMPRYCDLDDVCDLLASGKNIVTTRSEFLYPRKFMAPADYSRVEAACLQGRSTIHATGSSPGFITEAIPLTLASITSRIDHLLIDEFADLSRRPSPELLFQVMGFGRSPEAFARDKARLEEAGRSFKQSIQLLADHWGLAVTEFRSTSEVACVSSPVTIVAGTLGAGTVGGQRLSWSGLVEGVPRITIRTNWFCSRSIDPAWELADTGWKLKLNADTPLEITFKFAIPMDRFSEFTPAFTANRPVNAIPDICQAEPGLKTIMDLPWIHHKEAPRVQ